MTMITDLLRQSETKKNYPKGCNGQVRFVECCDNSEKIGWYNHIGTAKIIKLTFTDTKLKPGSEVYFHITTAGCDCDVITVKNCEKKDMDLTLMANFLAAKLIGFNAVVDPQDAKSILISGKPNQNFSVETNGFGITVNGVETPAKPTITTLQEAGKITKIGYGLAVVNNIKLHASQHGSCNSVIAGSDRDILELPTNHPTEVFVGITTRKASGTLMMPTDCCEPMDCEETYNCDECIHYLNTCCHNQELFVNLEPLPGGDLPDSLISLPIFYRHTVGATGTKLGALSILGQGDNTRSVAKNQHSQHEWIVTDVIDRATNLVTIGVQ